MDSITTTIQRKFAEQRVARLQQCQQIQEMLYACRRRRRRRDELNEANDNQDVQLEDSPMGIRFLRFYNWRHLDDNSCAREEHALWACRGMALRCGPELTELRACFATLSSPTTVLQAPGTLYDAAAVHEQPDDARIPCADIQRQVGACVRSNAQALYERQHQS